MEQEVCGKWKPRARTTCARRPLHLGECRTAKALADTRARKTARRVGKTLFTPEAKAKWNRRHNLKRYGLTEDDFERMLVEQDYACAMCFEPFSDDEIIYIDHDHNCCPDEKSSCGRCVRGLLNRRCNIAVGYIERYDDLARAYLGKTKTPQPQGPEVLPVLFRLSSPTAVPRTPSVSSSKSRHLQGVDLRRSPEPAARPGRSS